MTNTPTTFGFDRMVSPLVGLAICIALMPNATTVARTSSAVIEQFSAQALSVDRNERVGRIDIYLEEWSSDAEVTRLREPLRRADAPALITLLHAQRRRVGVLLMPGVQGRGARSRTRTPRNLLFARQVTTPAGRQVLLIADEHLGLGEPPIEARTSQVNEFNLLDIRFGADGTGVGKVITADAVVFNEKTGLLEAKDFAAHPARLVAVKADKP